MIADGKVDPQKTEWIDAYNQITNEEVSGTILTRVDASNHYLINEGMCDASMNTTETECSDTCRTASLTKKV
jgi:hypothetical protein